MNILFLDVDGVLNNDNCWLRKDVNDIVFIKGFRNEAFSKTALESLQQILEKFNCKIVVSSSWRHYDSDLKTLGKALESIGHEIFDITPDFRVYSNNERCRGHEIEDWICRHPEVENFVILDDDRDIGPVMKHLLKTKTSLGLQPHHVHAFEIKLKNNLLINEVDKC